MVRKVVIAERGYSMKQAILDFPSFCRLKGKEPEKREYLTNDLPEMRFLSIFAHLAKGPIVQRIE
jgi:hypothetical protein